jgi:hypothetical protein
VRREMNGDLGRFRLVPQDTKPKNASTPLERHALQGGPRHHRATGLGFPVEGVERPRGVQVVLERISEMAEVARGSRHTGSKFSIPISLLKRAALLGRTSRASRVRMFDSSVRSTTPRFVGSIETHSRSSPPLSKIMASPH